MESKLAQVLSKLDNLQRPSADAFSPARPGVPAARPNQPMDRSVGQRRNHLSRDTCKNCFQKAHWARFCPYTNGGDDRHSDETEQMSGGRMNVISGAHEQGLTSAVYLKVRLNGRS